MTKIIIDTNVYFSGFAFGGRLKDMLNTLNDDKFIVFCSFKLWDEITNIFVCGRLEKMLKNKYDHTQTIEFLDYLQTSLTFKITATKIDICRDTKDNMILELAQETGVDYIVTGDKDLLTLNPFGNTKIIKPSQFLELFN
jgi:uncharacterized protein